MSSTYPTSLESDTMRLRAVAGLVGGAVPALIGVAAWWLGVPYVATVAAAGVPIGAILAAAAARRATRPGWPGIVVLLALMAPFVAAVVLAVGGTAGDGGQLLVGLLFVSLYAELLGVPVTLPTALAAVVLLRRLGRMPAGRATRAAAGLAIVATVLGSGTLLAAVGPLAGPAADAGLAPVDWAARTAAVRLDLVIENRTPVDRYVEVTADLGDGSSAGSAFGVGPCEVVRQRLELESDRWAMFEGDATGDELGDPVAGRRLAGSERAPGTDPNLVVVFGPGAAVVVRADGPIPGEGAIDPERCG